MCKMDNELQNIKPLNVIKIGKLSNRSNNFQFFLSIASIIVHNIIELLPVLIFSVKIELARVQL